MSKMISAGITCRACKLQTPMQLYRSLWIEDPENSKLLFENRVNLFQCPSCDHSERLEFPFLATNAEKKFAVWYEPYYDASIDDDLAQYIKHTGENSYFSTAPRIDNWEYFKATIVDFESSRNVDRSKISRVFNNYMQDFINFLRK